MTNVLFDRSLPPMRKQGAEKINYHYFCGLDELKNRYRPHCITPAEFEEIRSFSRQSWTSKCEEEDQSRKRFQTTYSSYHKFRTESIEDGKQFKSRSRPTSPTRRNNPHPRRKFSTLHIKEAPGFQQYNASQALGPYKVGKQREKEKIYSDKKLYYSTPISEELKIWETRHLGQKDVNVSLHRWLKQAGFEEDEACKLRKNKFSQELNVASEVNAKYIGKLEPNRYFFGKY